MSQNKSQSCIMNNRLSTGYFNLHRETRHLDPLSPYTFILAIEFLFIEVRSDDSIQGFNINNSIYKTSAYADDAYYFLKNTGSLCNLFKLFSKFQEFSLLKGHRGKAYEHEHW